MNDLKKHFDMMNDIQMQEIFKILVKNGEKYTINANGIFVNISILKPVTLTEIKKYVEYCTAITPSLSSGVVHV